MYFDPSTPDLKQRLAALQPTVGYCIFVDIVDSTLLKKKHITEWASLVHNTFVNVTCFLGTQIVPLKIIGDCCMFYLTETKLAEMKSSRYHCSRRSVSSRLNRFLFTGRSGSARSSVGTRL